MKKVWMIGVALSALAACGETVPSSNGPGFSDYSQAVTGAPVTSTSLGSTTPAASAGYYTGITPETSTADATYVRGSGIEASPSNAAPVLYNHPGLSDEQDFAAVSARETIQSDAQRRASLASQYEVVQPTALPDRTDNGPNIVAYALSAPNRVGQEWYSRFVLSGQGRYQRNCAEYASADEAQIDFLSRGGPDRDPRGIDPDGDGFACAWDPAPFISAARSASGN